MKKEKLIQGWNSAVRKNTTRELKKTKQAKRIREEENKIEPGMRIWESKESSEHTKPTTHID